MKNIIFKTALTALAVVSLSSCNDYLDRTPLDSNSDATNWTSETALENFSWKFYDYLDELSYGSGWTRGQYHSETLTDDYATESFTEFTKNVPASSGAWNTPYSRIREANILLNRVDRVPGLSEEAANHWKGIARFFRALYHFQLVKTYGDVVWVEDEIDFSKEENVTRARDSRVTVMQNVVADLKFAAENCYSPDEATENTVNNMVANALLSRVALYEGTWEKYHNTPGGDSNTFLTVAKNAAAEVMNSGLYEVTTDYKGMYTSLSLVNNKEVLLYKIYTLANVNGGKVSMAHSQYGWIDSSTPTWGLTRSAMESYAMSDGLPCYQSSTYSDQSIAGIFENRDARLAATVYDQILPIIGTAWDYGIVSTTGFWTFKFLDLNQRANYEANGTWNAPSNDTDGPIFQYSEVLENYAEACAELGAITQSDLDKTVNLLRNKHGNLPALTYSGANSVSVNGTAITDDPNDASSSIILQEIRRDRRVELMADGFRHDDLMRWALGSQLDTKVNPRGYTGASVAALQEYCTSLGTTWSSIEGDNFFVDNYKSPYNTAAVNAGGTTVDRVWNDKYYLEPIPSGQITLDPNLGQNDGWK
ncbi:MAG: RagB/SusD family nutrient uptake outer membrane protein [Bacteroidales bacterium]|nr:RagB/SusD family nutrient uptake outer membrane protein [Bacteroidales bacterium]